jgi:hypothetical protein
MAKTTLADVLVEARQLGLERVELHRPQAQRFSREGFLEQACIISGLSLEALQEIDAKVTPQEAPYLDRLIASIVDDWRHVTVAQPGTHGRFSSADNGELAAAYADRRSLNLTPEHCSGVALLRVANDPRSTFGLAIPGQPGARLQEIGERLAELQEVATKAATLGDQVFDERGTAYPAGFVNSVQWHPFNSIVARAAETAAISVAVQIRPFRDRAFEKMLVVGEAAA